MSDKVISFIQPSRNNLKYLQWSYNSIRKNLGYRHEICWADDFSDDGTWKWMNEIVKKDPNVKIHRNEGPTRLGHTILYDTLVDMATSDIVMIYHADMYACPKMDEEVLKHLERGKVVSATRIERCSVFSKWSAPKYFGKRKQFLISHMLAQAQPAPSMVRSGSNIP